MSQAKRVSTTESPKSISDGAIVGSAPVLTFPATIDIPGLMSLTDKHSAYASVARTCLQLNQFAGSGSSAATSDSIKNNALFHDASFAKTISAFHAALMECAQSHNDRRCRILACKTLALVARSAYARIRHTPLLFGVREGTLHRLEDEVGTDVPVALCSVALEDPDDGVSACAVEALGMLTLASSGMVGTSVEDVLLREMEAIAHARPLPTAPTLMLLEDDDFSVAQLELQSRVYENVLSPRLWRLVQRIIHYSSLSHLMRSLPFLTACLGHLVLHTTLFGMDRSDYSKRWVEMDVPAMVDEVVASLLLPSMQQMDSGLAHCAALCTLRLAHACPDAKWMPQACRWVISVLVDATVACNILNQKMANLSALLISLRAISLKERVPTLKFVANEVRFLPSTNRVPAGVLSAGMTSSKDGSYRRPTRIGFLSEIALSFFVDAENTRDDNNAGNSRNAALKGFLSSYEVADVLSARSGKKGKKSRLGSTQSVATASSGEGFALGGKTPTEEYDGTHVGEEMVLTFCQVASKAGDKVMMPFGGERISSRHLEDWLRCSMTVLSTFSACVNWRSRILDESLVEEDHDVSTLFTVLTGAQVSYISLLQQCLYAVGLLSPASSVSLHVMPLAVPPGVTLLEEMARNTKSLREFESVGGVEFARKDFVTLVDQFLEYKLREGVASRHIRISLLALLTDYWVQSSHLSTAGDHQDVDEPAAMHINELTAREILANLSEQISSLTNEMSEDREDGQDQHNTETNEEYLRACVSCVENMGLTVCDWTRRFGASNQKYRTDLEEDARYIIAVALAALDGKNIRNGDEAEESKGGSLMPICTDAARRIKDAAAVGGTMQADVFGIGGEAPALYSNLVSKSRADAKSGMEFKSYLSTTPVSISNDSFQHAHLTQYCQQVIGSRFDMAIWSSPLASFDSTHRTKAQSVLAPESSYDGGRDETLVPNSIRSKNPFRLSVPPPHPSRVPTIAWGPGARMCWNGSTSMITAGSDPVAVVLSYTARRIPRYDCEPKYSIVVTMKVHNITAVEIAKGVRLCISVTHAHSSNSNTTETLNNSEETDENNELFSTSTVYKQEVHAGDQLMWEVSLPQLPTYGTITLRPSILFREVEGEQWASRWVGKSVNDISTNENDNGSSGTTATETSLDEGDSVLDVTLSCEPVPLSSFAMLQPCPLIFFRHAFGDEGVFRFLWLQLPYQAAPVKLIRDAPFEPNPNIDELALAVSNLCLVALHHWDEANEANVKGWAFATLSGRRIFCVLSLESNGTSEDATLQLRADDENLIKSFMDETNSLSVFVQALTSNRWICDGGITLSASAS